MYERDVHIKTILELLLLISFAHSRLTWNPPFKNRNKKLGLLQFFVNQIPKGNFVLAAICLVLSSNGVFEEAFFTRKLVY
jgi:hypothetical protein